jgi:UTP-glucose-1-phosphate uridylyltransferase
MISVILAAAGLGSRLYNETIEIPKPLVLYKSKPIIAYLIDIYKKISDDIVIVISSCQKGKLLKAWITDYYKNPNYIKFVVQPKPNGTNDAVYRALDIVKNENCLYAWADTIPDEKQFLDAFNEEENTFFLSSIECRFGMKNFKIVQKCSNPGFMGIYYLKQKPELDLSKEDFIENFIGQNVNTKTINSISLGTLNELFSANAFENSSNRFFNKVEFEKDFVVKIPLTSAAIELQKKEVYWYENASKSLKSYIPKHEYDGNQLKLERIYGKSLIDCELGKDFWRKDFPKLLLSLHQSSSVDVDKQSCIDTYINKPKQRYYEVKNIIDSWFDGNVLVNGEDYNRFEFPNIPKDLFPKYFTFCHSDLNMSNAMIDLNGNIRIFDPRGYFGNVLLFGDPAYDIAKILYALDGFDKINENKFSLNKIGNDTILIYKKTEFNKDMKWFFKYACDKYEISNEKLNFLLFGIWMSFTSYVINSPLAVVAAYCKAMERSRKFLI